MIAENTQMKTRFLPVLVAVVLFCSCYSKVDEADALKVAANVNSQLQSSNFKAIYKEDSQVFQQAIDETTFVSGMTQLFKDNGAIRTITPVAYQSGIDSKAGKTYILLFDLALERTRVRERMVFIRDSSGEMQLWDLIMDRIP